MSRTHRKLNEKWRQIYHKPDINPRTGEEYRHYKLTKCIGARLHGDDGTCMVYKFTSAQIDNYGGFKIDNRSTCIHSKHKSKAVSKARRAAGKKLTIVGLEDYEKILDDRWLANQSYLDDDWYDCEERRNYEDWLDELEEKNRLPDYYYYWDGYDYIDPNDYY